jgi:hypothetical protein
MHVSGPRLLSSSHALKVYARSTCEYREGCEWREKKAEEFRLDVCSKKVAESNLISG